MKISLLLLFFLSTSTFASQAGLSQQDAEQRIFNQLADLSFQLVSLVGNLINHFVDALKPRALVIPSFQAIIDKLKDELNAAWNNAKPIIEQIASDLTNQIGNVSEIVAQVIAQLIQILTEGNDQRGIVDFIVDAFGLATVWNQITSVGSALFNQFIAVCTKIIFSGKELFDKAWPVFIQLVKDLTNHTGDAITIVSQAIAQLNAILVSGK